MGPCLHIMGFCSYDKLNLVLMKTDNNHDYFTKVHCVRDIKIIIIIVFTISQFGMFSTYILLPVLQRKSRNKYVSLSLR